MRISKTTQCNGPKSPRRVSSKPKFKSFDEYLQSRREKNLEGKSGYSAYRQLLKSFNDPKEDSQEPPEAFVFVPKEKVLQKSKERFLNEDHEKSSCNSVADVHTATNDSCTNGYKEYKNILRRYNSVKSYKDSKEDSQEVSKEQVLQKSEERVLNEDPEKSSCNSVTNVHTASNDSCTNGYKDYKDVLRRYKSVSELQSSPSADQPMNTFRFSTHDLTAEPKSFGTLGRVKTPNTPAYKSYQEFLKSYKNASQKIRNSDSPNQDVTKVESFSCSSSESGFHQAEDLSANSRYGSDTASVSSLSEHVFTDDESLSSEKTVNTVLSSVSGTTSVISESPRAPFRSYSEFLRSYSRQDVNKRSVKEVQPCSAANENTESKFDEERAEIAQVQALVGRFDDFGKDLLVTPTETTTEAVGDIVSPARVVDVDEEHTSMTEIVPVVESRDVFVLDGIKLNAEALGRFSQLFKSGESLEKHTEEGSEEVKEDIPVDEKVEKEESFETRVQEVSKNEDDEKAEEDCNDTEIENLERTKEAERIPIDEIMQQVFKTSEPNNETRSDDLEPETILKFRTKTPSYTSFNEFLNKYKANRKSLNMDMEPVPLVENPEPILPQAFSLEENEEDACKEEVLIIRVCAAKQFFRESPAEEAASGADISGIARFEDKCVQVDLMGESAEKKIVLGSGVLFQSHDLEENIDAIGEDDVFQDAAAVSESERCPVEKSHAISLKTTSYGSYRNLLNGYREKSVSEVIAASKSPSASGAND